MIPIGTVIELPSGPEDRLHKFVVISQPHPSIGSPYDGKILLANLSSIKVGKCCDTTTIIAEKEWTSLYADSYIRYDKMIIASEEKIRITITEGTARFYPDFLPLPLVKRIQDGISKSIMSDPNLIRFYKRCLGGKMIAPSLGIIQPKNKQL